MSRLVKVIRALIDMRTSKYDLTAHYPAKVLAQSADLSTVDVRPDSPKFNDQLKVPIRLPFPGLQIKVSAGARVHLAFEEMRETKMVAIPCWEPGNLVEIRFGGGTAAIGRVGDAVNCQYLVFSSGGTFVGTFPFTPAGLAAATAAAVGGGVVVPIAGAIAAGSPNAKG